MFIKGIRFPDIEAIKRAVMKELQRISGESFQECMEAWRRSMGRCVRFKDGSFQRGTEIGKDALQKRSKLISDRRISLETKNAKTYLYISD